MGIAMFTAMETKNILYIDTGGSLSATRIKDMLQEWNASLDEQVWTCNTKNVMAERVLLFFNLLSWIYHQLKFKFWLTDRIVVKGEGPVILNGGSSMH